MKPVKTNKNEIFSGKAIYTNSILKETYTLAGVSDLGRAWELAQYAANRNGWDVIDVTVKFVA